MDSVLTPTPAPERETPTPAPERETPAPERETPTPERETPTPAPERERPTPAPERETPAPERETPTPERETPTPERETPTPAPERETPTPERCCQEQENTENKAESRTGWCSGMQSPQGCCHAAIVDSSKGGVTGNDTEGTLEVNTEGGEIDHCEADQAQSVKSVNENQADKYVTAMTSWSVDVDGAGGGGGGGVNVTADVISDSAAMSRRRNTNNNTAASSTTPPPPSVDDSARADRSVKRGSDRPEPPQTPDTGLLSSHGAGDDLRETNDVFCASSTTSGTNCIESCASSQRHEGCQKRSALIFPELVADVGGCLCTRRSLRQTTRQPAVSTPDLFAMLPDLITSHRFLINAEVNTY